MTLSPLSVAFSLAALAPGASSIKSVTAVAPGVAQTCVLLSTGAVKCWGRNDVGQLGLGHKGAYGTSPDELGDALPAIDLGTGAVATQIASTYHTCALLRDDSVKCWGQNSSGELGLGDTIIRGYMPEQMGDALPVVNLGTGLKPKALAVGLNHSCALFTTGQVKCWGQSYEGQIGLGDAASRGIRPGQMGDALPFVDLGSGRTASAIAAGTDHTCALLDHGAVKCWGENFFGELGLGDARSRGVAPGQMGDDLPAVDLGPGRTAVAVTAGRSFSCALLDDGSAKCWGRNDYGQLGLGTTQDHGKVPGQMGANLPAIEFGTGRGVLAISAGNYFAGCALLDDQSLKCWGLGTTGQLGLDDPSNRGTAPGQMGDALPAVNLQGFPLLSVAVGHGFTCAILGNGGLKCWGINTYGQLGSGDVISRGGAPGDMATVSFARLWD